MKVVSRISGENSGIRKLVSRDSTENSVETVKRGDVYHIRNCSSELLREFTLVQRRLRTRTKAETLQALVKISLLKLDGHLVKAKPTGIPPQTAPS